MTEAFAADWLALREPCDTAARSADLADAFLAALPPQPRILDLGAGTGANARYLINRAAARGISIDSLLVDGDATLLRRVEGLPRHDTRVVDFADPARLDLTGIDGVTASALFDLVSVDWFSRFVAALDGRPLLAALTAEGPPRWTPEDPDDAAVADWFDADMRRDKGFGPAMGLAAPAAMQEVLAGAGYTLRAAATPWVLGPEPSALRAALIDGIAEAAARHGDGEVVAAWRHRRQAAAESGLCIGHRDILAVSRGGAM